MSQDIGTNKFSYFEIVFGTGFLMSSKWGLSASGTIVAEAGPLNKFREKLEYLSNFLTHGNPLFNT